MDTDTPNYQSKNQTGPIRRDFQTQIPSTQGAVNLS